MAINADKLQRVMVAQAAFFLTILIWPQVTLGNEPLLAICLVEGQSSLYNVSEIERVCFAGHTLVVVSESGSDTFEVGAITRIQFLWEFSHVHDPEDMAALVEAAHLFQNQPNPFSPETRILYELERPGRVELEIYNVLGRLIRTLVDEEQSIGPHSVQWDGRDEWGRKADGGAYFYRLTAPGISTSRRMILLP